MKVAVIILCHKNLINVDRLAKTFPEDEFDIYIHIDKKTREDYIFRGENITLVKDRINVIWGNFSQVESTLSSIKDILESGNLYSHVWLISGQDYPIKTSKYFIDFFENNQKNSYMEMMNKKSVEYRHFMKRVDIYYPHWMMKNHWINKVFKKIWIYISGGENKTYSLLKRKKVLIENFCFGSSWWCLNFDDLKIIYDYTIKNYDLLYNFFNHTCAPDECFFQTLYHNLIKKEVQNNLTYVDWSQNLRNPKILNIEDALSLKNSKCLIARKFDENSEKLIKEIDKWRNENE